jgi:hypothetical protein
MTGSDICRATDPNLRYLHTPGNVYQFTGPYDHNSVPSTPLLSGIDNANHTLGSGYGYFYFDAYHQGYSYQPVVWNPLSGNRLLVAQSGTNLTGGNATASSTGGDVAGWTDVTGGGPSQAAVWPLGVYLSNITNTILPPATNVFNYSSSYATGVAEDGTVYGYVANSVPQATVAWWKPDAVNPGQYVPKQVKPPDGNLAYAYAASISGYTVGTAKFQTNAQNHAFVLASQPSDFAFDGFELGTLADTGSGTYTNRFSEAWDVKEDFGIVGDSYNTNGVLRAFFVPCNLPTTVTAITTNSALPGLPGVTGTTWTSAAYALGRTGIAVGYAQTNSGGTYTSRAVMWTPPAGSSVQNPPAASAYSITDLNSLVATNSGIVLQSAIGINSSGFIICNGLKSGSLASFLLYPKRGSN